MYNLLTDPIIQSRPLGFLTLPGVLAALSRHEINDYPAMRSHQVMFWHMFCVQLGAMALRGEDNLPQTEEDWRDFLRTMTPDHPDDTPWTLAVDDWTKPAFMQAAVPDNVALENDILSVDALDILITAKNHDIKQAYTTHTAEDWLFALVALQTGDGYGGSGNYGIARMNGGSSSRVLVGLAPVGIPRSIAPNPGAWFTRDTRVLLDKSVDLRSPGFKVSEGLGLTWLAPWPEGEKLQISDLDRFFIEICRRIRLISCDGNIVAKKGTSKSVRIDAKSFQGALADPWAPVHKTENKSLTIGEDGDFDYRQILELAFSSNWNQPLLAKLAKFENANTRMTLVTQALARGNCKTGGFRCRMTPVIGKVVPALGNTEKRREIHEIGKEQARNIKNFSEIMAHALVMAVARGNTDMIKSKDYIHAKTAQSALNRHADQIFFSFLWRRFNEKNDDAKGDFIRNLWQATREIFERSLVTIPIGSFMRPKAEAKARNVLYGRVMNTYGVFLNIREGSNHAK